MLKFNWENQTVCSFYANLLHRDIYQSRKRAVHRGPKSSYDIQIILQDFFVFSRISPLEKLA